MNSNRAPKGLLVVDRQSPALKEALWRLVREAKQDGGILAPVTVVGPSQYANLSLRQELGRNGFANVRFVLMPMLAELLGGAAMARANRRPLTSVLENVMVRAVLDQAGEPLSQVREHRSTQSSVRESFRKLRHVPDSVLSELETSGGVRREVVRLYRDFRERTAEGWYDNEDMARAAADAVGADAAPALRELGQLVFYLHHDLTPGEVNLVRALALRRPCAVLLGSTGDNDADAPLNELAATLRPLLGEPQVADGGGSQVPHESRQQVLLPGEAEINVAPDAHTELRCVIREIMAKAQSGIPFHRMAVLYGMDPLYGSLVRDELALAAIPAAGPGRKSLGDTAVGRTLAGLLNLAAGLGAEDALRRDDVMAWLTGIPVRRPRKMKRADFSPARWDSISRKAGVVRGLRQWRKELTTYADQREREAEKADDEVSGASLDVMREDSRAARAALFFIEELAHDLRSPRNGARWQEFCRWAEELLRKYLRRSLSDDESAARERVYRMLQELQAADGLDSVATLTAFRQVVEDYSQRTEGHIGITGEGVFVAPFFAAAGMSFDAVWMVGMVEGSAPPPPKDDPLLPDDEWRRAGGPPVLARRSARHRYDYLSALASAPRRALSFPAADPELRRRAFPSPWLLEQASALEGDAVTSDSLLRLKRPWLTVTVSLEGSLSDLEVPADRQDYDLQRLLLWKREHPSTVPRRNDDVPHPLAKYGPLARAAHMVHGRSDSSLTEYDGNLSSVAENARFAMTLGRYPLSPTSLETWALCPFRYFLGHVLHLSALDDPEEETTISRLNRGSLVHEVLEKFIEDARETGNLPTPGQFWGEESSHRLRQIANDVFHEYEMRDLTGRPVLWLVEKQNILGDLDEFLAKDAELRAQYGSASTIPEAKFGRRDEWRAAVDEGTQVAFRGNIDRIDLNSDGSPTLIVDYKTSRSADSIKALNADPIDRGRRLQLGAYSLAARQRFPQAERLPAIYWFVTERGGFKTAPDEPFDINDSETLGRFREGVSAIVEGIRGGVFPANPGAQGWGSNCTHCDFNTLCQSRRVRHWERKRDDPLLSGYLSLSGEDRPQLVGDDSSLPLEEGQGGS